MFEFNISMTNLKSEKSYPVDFHFHRGMGRFPLRVSPQNLWPTGTLSQWYSWTDSDTCQDSQNHTSHLPVDLKHNRSCSKYTLFVKSLTFMYQIDC